MPSASDSSDLLLRAHGVLYRVEVELEESDLDWLDRVILDATTEPQTISDLIRCFGLPRRMLEDAIGTLIEQHLLLLDVSKAQVRATGLPTRFQSATRQRRTLLLWQDHVTGTVLPWPLVEPFAQQPIGDLPEVQDLLVGPPQRTVLQMSDAELLSRLERYRPDAAWSEVVAERERADSKTLWVRAVRRAGGSGVVILDDIPIFLLRQWGRYPDVGEAGSELRQRVALPASWRQLVGDWTQQTHDRIGALCAGKRYAGGDLEALTDSLARIRETLVRNYRLEFVADGTAVAKQRVRHERQAARHHRVVVTTSYDQSTWNDVVSLLQVTDAESRVLVLAGSFPRSARQTIARTGADLMEQRTGSVDSVFLNDRELLTGGLHYGQRYMLRLRSARPIMAFVSWLPEASVWDAVSSAPMREAGENDTERALQRAAALHNAVRDLELQLNATDGVLAAELAERLVNDLTAAESSLLQLSPNPVRAMELDEVLAALDDYPGARVLVRATTSPLATAATNHELIVWSKEAPANGTRWIQEAGPGEVVLIGDVVLLGWALHAESAGDRPPFFAIHSADVAQEIRRRTDHAPIAGR